jgi:hypothetical protein
MFSLCELDNRPDTNYIKVIKIKEAKMLSQIISRDKRRLAKAGVDREDIFFAQFLIEAVDFGLRYDDVPTVCREMRETNGDFEIDARPPWREYIKDTDWTRYEGIHINSLALEYGIKWGIICHLKGWNENHPGNRA